MDGFERRREQKKLNILEASLDLFMDQGIQAVSVAQIAKEANVSQVTIYNYFESKQKLIHEVFNYYLDSTTAQFEQILKSNLDYPEKVKQIIFNKKETAKQIHNDLYQYFMKEYVAGENYIEKLYVEKALPLFINLFNEGRTQGYIDPNLSNEAILFYIQMLMDAMQKKEVYESILPFTEDIMNLLFYGILGRRN